MTTQRPGLIARFTGLIRGLFTGWLRDREEQNPRAVYENAIAERVKQYRELKEAVAGILYMRNKLEGEIADRSKEISMLLEDIRRSVRAGDDDAALLLVQRKQSLTEDLEHAQRELEGVRGEADEAKANLVRFRDEIRSLEREKGRILASLANARARRRIQEALSGISVDADMRALESVREHVNRITTEGQLDREIQGEHGMEARLREIRAEAHRDAAARELEELKRRMGPGAAPAAKPAKADGSDPARTSDGDPAVDGGVLMTRTGDLSTHEPRGLHREDPFDRAVERVEAQERVASQVRLVAALHAVLGALGVGAGLLTFLLIAPWGWLTGDPELTALLGGIGALVGGFLGLLGAPHLAAAWGLSRRRPWGRVLGIVLSAFQLMNVPLGTVIGGLSLFVLLQEPGRRYFERDGGW